MISPGLLFDLRVSNNLPQERIHAVLLRCQIQIEVARRRYSSSEQQQLRELFDEPSRWGETLRPITWTNVSLNLAAFSGSTTTSLIVPCSFDFSAATAKYFHSLDEGEVPLTFLFSGSVFHENGVGALQVAPISWNKESRFRLPVQTWKSVMDLHFPNIVPLNIRRDVFEEFYRLKMTLGLPTFEETIQHMIALVERERPAS